MIPPSYIPDYFTEEMLELMICSDVIYNSPNMRILRVSRTTTPINGDTGEAGPSGSVGPTGLAGRPVLPAPSDAVSPPEEWVRFLPDIESVTHKDGATTIKWIGGSKTRVKCGNNESFDKYAGFCAAITKKIFGSTSAAKKTRTRKDIETLKAIAEADREKRLFEEARKNEKKRKNLIKRKAKRILIDREAKRLAEKMES